MQKNRSLRVVSGFDDAKMQKHLDHNKLEIKAIKNIELRGGELSKKEIQNEYIKLKLLRQQEEIPDEEEEKKFDFKAHQRMVGKDAKSESEEEDKEDESEEEEENDKYPFTIVTATATTNNEEFEEFDVTVKVNETMGEVRR